MLLGPQRAGQGTPGIGLSEQPPGLSGPQVRGPQFEQREGTEPALLFGGIPAIPPLKGRVLPLSPRVGVGTVCRRGQNYRKEAFYGGPGRACLAWPTGRG